MHHSLTGLQLSHRPTQCPLAHEPAGCRHPLRPFPWFPICSGSTCLGSSVGVRAACACPHTTPVRASHSSQLQPPSQPAPSSLQMMAGTAAQHTVMPNPGLPAVGVPKGHVARLLEQARQPAMVCHGTGVPCVPCMPWYATCAMVCDVSHCTYSDPLPTPCIPLLLHTIAITLSSYLLLFIVHPLHMSHTH